jgi:tetratricopeptide (TPR) repeat protein
MARKIGGKKKQHSLSGPEGRRGLEAAVVRQNQVTKQVTGNDWIIAAALALVTFAVYAQVITHQFISLDDDVYIRDNPMVNAGITLNGMAWAFTTFHEANWHPVTWISHMVDSQIFGLNAGGHLFVNLVLHVANTLLLFFFLKQGTGARRKSATIAALFALHPLHVESVAWAAERKDTLSTLFGLLSLRAYLSYTKAPGSKRYALVAFWLGLGLMAKPMLVTWPFVFLLLDYWPLRRLSPESFDWVRPSIRPWIPLLREKLPLFGLVAASMVVTYVAQSYGGAVRGFVDAPISLRLSNAVVAYAKYLFLTFWPSGLGVYYPFSTDGVPVWQVAGALVVLGTITGLAVRQASRQPYLLMGWLWFLGTLVPVIGLVQVGGQTMADRYHYIPSIGLFVAIVFTFCDLALALRINRLGLAAVGAISLIVLASVTAVQASRWQDSKTLFEHTLSVTPDNLLVQYDLGHALGQEKKYDEAIPHFLEALRIQPDFFDALFNMGVTLFEQGKLQEAESYFRRALQAKPESGKTHMQLALALVNEEKADEALAEFYKALELAPMDSNVRTNLGLMLARKGKVSEAISQLNEALRLNPNSAEAHNNLGFVFLASGQPEKSIAHFSDALRLKPDFTLARNNLRRAERQIEAKQK